MKKYTEDEKIIAKSIDKKYKWLAREKNGSLFALSAMPIKKENSGFWYDGEYADFIAVSALFGQELFKSIKWEDDEPTRISDIYNPQILDDAERECLKTVLKPVHHDIECVKKITYRDGQFEFIEVTMNNHRIGMVFPDFEAAKRYTGMKPNEAYTLDELGITYD